eukprot:2283488-Prymnesium_polylepis.4
MLMWDICEIAPGSCRMVRSPIDGKRILKCDADHLRRACAAASALAGLRHDWMDWPQYSQSSS